MLHSLCRKCVHLYIPYYVGVCTCRFLEEYLDSKRPLSPVSPLSDTPKSTKPLPTTKTPEQNYLHVHKNRDSSIKVIECGYWGHPNTNAFFVYIVYFTCFWPVHSAQDGGGMRQSVKTSPTTIRLLGPCRTPRGCAKPWNVSNHAKSTHCTLFQIRTHETRGYWAETLSTQWLLCSGVCYTVMQAEVWRFQPCTNNQREVMLFVNATTAGQFVTCCTCVSEGVLIRDVYMSQLGQTLSFVFLSRMMAFKTLRVCFYFQVLGSCCCTFLFFSLSHALSWQKNMKATFCFSQTKNKTTQTNKPKMQENASYVFCWIDTKLATHHLQTVLHKRIQPEFWKYENFCPSCIRMSGCEYNKFTLSKTYQCYCRFFWTFQSSSVSHVWRS